MEQPDGFLHTSLTVQGGVPLKGTVSASGSKNSALPIMAATILLDGETELTNVPYLSDTIMMSRMLNALGIRAEFHSNKRFKIRNSGRIKPIAPYELVTAMRASFFVAGPILARIGMAKIPLPGGCAIGARPINLHLKGFEAMGAEIRLEHGFVFLKANELHGAKINLDFPSVGATENIMMAASLAKGTTIIENAAREPEITDLGQFLVKAGAKISGFGTQTIVIEGVERLNGTHYDVISDRVEVGTLLIAGIVTKGDVTVKNACVDDSEPLIQKLKESKSQHLR